MSRRRLRMPDTALVSAVAALTTWVSLLSWTPFHERSSTYLVPLFGVCLLVALTGAVLRTARVPAVLVALAQVAVVGLVLHKAWVGAYAALGGWLPTGESVRRLDALLSAAVDASRSYAAPVPANVTEFAPLMVVAGAATAVLVDFLACGLRRAPLAGLPLLAVYTAPVSILDGGVSWVKFAMGAVCFLFLLACQEAGRLAHWGQQVTGSGRVFDTQDTRVSSNAVWSSARKIGFTATGLAVLVPILVPTMSVGLFRGSGPGDGPGNGSVTISNPIVEMHRDLVQGPDFDLVRVTTNDPDPNYLRLTALDVFDGKTWEPSRRSIPVENRAEGLVPRPPGLDPSLPRKRYTWSVQTTSELDSKWLPAPYPVFSITAPGDWRYDRDTLDFFTGVDDQRASDRSYQLERLSTDPTATQLAYAPPAPADIFQPNTQLPDMPEVVTRLAQDVTRGAKSKFEMAIALQQWFRVDGGFTYTTESAPGNGVDELVRFLERGPQGRRGYCEQFASAMAVMGRTLGIPSRVAVGFLKPTQIDKNTYVYSAHDLHAWPEMYFQGAGWIRFEPTPDDRTGNGVPAYTREQVDRQEPSASASASLSVSQQPNRFDRSSAPAAGGRGSGSGSSLDGTVALAVGGGVVLLLVLLALPRLLRSWVRRRRWAAVSTPASLAEAAWAELRDTATDLGVTWSDAVTLRTRARELVRSFGRPGSEDDALARSATRGHGVNPEAEGALQRLVQLLERARYSRGLAAGAAEVSSVRADLDTCVAALAAGAGGRRRTKATWFPASLWGSRRARSARRGRGGAVLLGEAGVDHVV